MAEKRGDEDDLSRTPSTNKSNNTASRSEDTEAEKAEEPDNLNDVSRELEKVLDLTNSSDEKKHTEEAGLRKPSASHGVEEGSQQRKPDPFEGGTEHAENTNHEEMPYPPASFPRGNTQRNLNIPEERGILGLSTSKESVSFEHRSPTTDTATQEMSQNMYEVVQNSPCQQPQECPHQPPNVCSSEILQNSPTPAQQDCPNEPQQNVGSESVPNTSCEVQQGPPFEPTENPSNEHLHQMDDESEHRSQLSASAEPSGENEPVLGDIRFECPVCRDGWTAYVYLPCGHGSCHSCCGRIHRICHSCRQWMHRFVCIRSENDRDATDILEDFSGMEMPLHRDTGASNPFQDLPANDGMELDNPGNFVQLHNRIAGPALRRLRYRQGRGPTSVHPTMSCVLERLRSLRTRWRGGGNLHNLALAGFFASTVNDTELICFHCGNGIRILSHDNDPWEIHLALFPFCRHLRRSGTRNRRHTI